jgi:hypothetical protein
MAASENPCTPFVGLFSAGRCWQNPHDTNGYRRNLPPSPAKKILAGGRTRVFGGCLLIYNSRCSSFGISRLYHFLP